MSMLETRHLVKTVRASEPSIFNQIGSLPKSWDTFLGGSLQQGFLVFGGYIGGFVCWETVSFKYSVSRKRLRTASHART